MTKITLFLLKNSFIYYFSTAYSDNKLHYDKTSINNDKTTNSASKETDNRLNCS